MLSLRPNKIQIVVLHLLIVVSSRAKASRRPIRTILGFPAQVTKVTTISLTPQWQLSIFWTFFPFGLKWKPLLRRHVMISVKTFSPRIKTINSSFMKIIYIFNIFYHLRAVNESKSEVWKGRISCHCGVNIIYRETNTYAIGINWTMIIPSPWRQ